MCLPPSDTSGMKCLEWECTPKQSPGLCTGRATDRTTSPAAVSARRGLADVHADLLEESFRPDHEDQTLVSDQGTSLQLNRLA